MSSLSNVFIPYGLPTLIGSLPADNHRQALDWILKAVPEIPLWPQLPAIPRERMLNQFSEGLPGIHEDNESIYFDLRAEGFEDELLQFYEDYLLAVEHPGTIFDSRFVTTLERAAGLYLLAEQSGKVKERAVAVKGQITGPFTMLTGISDVDHKLGYYDPTFRDLIIKGIALKAAWQTAYLKRSFDLPVLMFIDEPALAGLGSSSFISISLEDIAQDLAEIINAIHAGNGLAGIHVCANTDWNLLLGSEVDIISFDAYTFFDRFITSRNLIHAFLERGAHLAWGIVPTAEPEQVEKESCETLVKRWEEQAEGLSGNKWDVSSLLRQTIITPSCGTGSLPPELAKKVLYLTKEVSAELRKKYLNTEITENRKTPWTS